MPDSSEVFGFKPNQLSQILSLLRRPQPSQGIPDSGPFMSDTLKKMARDYGTLAPGVKMEDPFALFPRPLRSGGYSNPYQRSTFEEP